MTYIKLGMMDFTNLRILFGPDEVQQKLKTSKLSMDMWFTGGDFAGVAATQLQTAIRRRFLSLTWTCFVICIFWDACVLNCPQEISPFGINVYELSHLRYGFEVDWLVGRACDIAGHSRKMLGMRLSKCF